MVFYRRHRISVIFAAITLAWILACVTVVRADPAAPPQCPTPGEPCKILYLSPQEERLLIAPNGIIDTAAQGRQIDLGGFAVYLKSKIATAPAGEVQKLPDAAAKADKPVDNTAK